MSGCRFLGLVILLWWCNAGILPALEAAHKAVRTSTPRSALVSRQDAGAALQGRVAVRPGIRLGKINPNIYGHFAEQVFRVFYGGLWAEILEARKFEGRDGEYGVIKPWYAIGRSAGTHFLHDNTVFYSGGQSQRIVSSGTPGHEAGVGQKGLYLQEGKSYEVRINVRQQGITAPLVVALEGENGNYASHRLMLSGGDWQRFSFKLTSSAADRGGRFAIKFSGPGTLWIGTASLMPDDHLSGYRKDVVESLREIRVPNLRWPGGNFVSYYRWEDAIGDRDRRPSRLNLSRVIEGEGRYWEPNDVGVDEFLELCRLIGAEPYLAVNAGDGTPDEAARWLEYCNLAQYSVRREAGRQRASATLPRQAVGHRKRGVRRLAGRTCGRRNARPACRRIRAGNARRRSGNHAGGRGCSILVLPALEPGAV